MQDSSGIRLRSLLAIFCLAWVCDARAATKLTDIRIGKFIHTSVTEIQVPSTTAETPPPVANVLPEAVPPKLRGLSADAIARAAPGDVSDVVIVMKYQPPIALSSAETPEARRRTLDDLLTDNRRSQTRLRSVLSAVKGRIVEEYKLLNAVHAYVLTQALSLLMNMDEVLSIEANAPMSSGSLECDRTYQNQPIVPVDHDQYASLLHFGSNDYPYPTDPHKGEGQTVAVVDSGIDEEHPALNGENPGKILYHHRWDANLGDSSCENGECQDSDPGGHPHGTSVAGLIAGQLDMDDPHYAYRGIAPAATLFNEKFSDLVADLPRAIDDAAAEHNGHKASVVNVSDQLTTLCDFNGSYPNYWADGYSSPALALDRAYDAGLVPVVIAGNNGNFSCSEGDVFYHLMTPGDARKAITVGAIGPQTLTRKSYSGYGPTRDVSQRTEPALVAPTDCWTLGDPNNPAADYQCFDGTSAAAPLVAGIAAVERQWHLKPFPNDPGWTVSYLIHEGSNRSVDPYTGAGLIHGNFLHEMVGYQTGYSDSIRQGVTKRYAFILPPGTGNLAVTLWWPERWDNSRTSNQYHSSQMKLEILKPGGKSLASDSAPTGVFKHMILDTASLSMTPGLYFADVTGVVADSFPGSSEQPFYLWITPLPSAY
jgi:subtilisin family serine protease